MIIKSYLAFPLEGKLQELTQLLQSHPRCTVAPATNREMVALVTESEDEAADQLLEKELRALPPLQVLTFVSGHNDLPN